MAALDVVSLNIERPVDAHHLPTIETLHIIAERPNQDTPYGVHFATTETEALRSGPTVVQQVGHGSICELAGLRKGDQLVELNGVSVSTLQHNEVEQMFSASSRIEVTVSRSGKSKMDMHYENLHIMVTNAPGEPLGFVFESLHHNGATVVELVRENTAAYAAGLMEGDEIFEINKHRITDELSHHNLVLMLTEPRPPGVPLILGVRRPMDGVEFTEKDLYFKESNSADKLGMHITSEDIGMSEVRCAFFRQKFTLEVAIGSHSCSLEALACV
jgi:hypothetical protein